jgi:uncharacterized membrane protein
MITKAWTALKAALCSRLMLAASYTEWLPGIPVWLRTLLIAVIPIVELRGAIPAAKIWGMGLGTAYLWAVIGNMIPIPFILLFLGPFSDWLRRHSQIMDRFFTWLFARTRRKHTKSFERWRDLALCIFVAIPLPGTGAWTGALVAFLFDVPFWRALFWIFLGVLLAGAAVTTVVYFVSTVPLWVTLASLAAMIALLVAVWLIGRRERVEDGTDVEAGAGG